jgi:rubredoxin
VKSESKPAAAGTVTHDKLWQCELCAFSYDEAAGLPEEGIAPGTPWAQVPHDFICPDCSATKADFTPLDL